MDQESAGVDRRSLRPLGQAHAAAHQIGRPLSRPIPANIDRRMARHPQREYGYGRERLVVLRDQRRILSEGKLRDVELPVSERTEVSFLDLQVQTRQIDALRLHAPVGEIGDVVVLTYGKSERYSAH